MFDLPIALGMLAGSGQIESGRLDRIAVVLDKQDLDKWRRHIRRKEPSQDAYGETDSIGAPAADLALG